MWKVDVCILTTFSRGLRTAPLIPPVSPIGTRLHWSSQVTQRVSCGVKLVNKEVEGSVKICMLRDSCLFWFQSLLGNRWLTFYNKEGVWTNRAHGGAGGIIGDTASPDCFTFIHSVPPVRLDVGGLSRWPPAAGRVCSSLFRRLGRTKPGQVAGDGNF